MRGRGAPNPSTVFNLSTLQRRGVTHAINARIPRAAQEHRAVADVRVHAVAAALHQRLLCDQRRAVYPQGFRRALPGVDESVFRLHGRRQFHVPGHHDRGAHPPRRLAAHDAVLARLYRRSASTGAGRLRPEEQCRRRVAQHVPGNLAAAAAVLPREDLQILRARAGICGRRSALDLFRARWACG